MESTKVATKSRAVSPDAINSSVVYLNIWQILSDAALSTAPEAIRNVACKRIPTLEECMKHLVVHVARNCVSEDPSEFHHAENSDISHITWEFQDVQAMFFSVATFDGTGPYGTAANRFAMPGQKINHAQKALVLLSLMEFSMKAGLVEGSFEKFKAKVQANFDGGVSDLSLNYDQISKVSRNIIASHLNGGKVVSVA